MSVPSIEHGTPTESLKERGERLLERRTNRPMVLVPRLVKIFHHAGTFRFE
jgi:hypothetical protein